MKKISKIVASLFVICILCTALAFIVLADGVTGIIEKKAENYDNHSLTAGGDSASLGGKFAWTISNRRGTTSIGVGIDGNKYALFTQTNTVAPTSKDAPYLGTGYGCIGSTIVGGRPLADANGNLTRYDTNSEYLVVDFDIAAPSGVFTTGAVQLELRAVKAGTSYNAAGTFSSLAAPSLNSRIAFNFGNDDGGSYIYNSIVDSKIYINPYEFSHITIVYDKVETSSYVSVDMYAYLNGELFASVKGTDPTGGVGASWYYDSIPHLAWDEVRFNFSDTSDRPDNTVAFDNLSARIIDSSYNGNLAEVLSSKGSITGWESNVYSPESMPKGVLVAKVGDAQFDSLKKAVDAAEAGATITLFKNTNENITVSKIVDINLGGYSANITPAAGFIIDDSVNGVYSVKEAPLAIEYVNASGETVYIREGLGTLNEAFSLAKAGTTIKLLDDVTITSQVNVTKNLTLDLNGKTLSMCTTGTKFDGFSIKKNISFTLTSSTVGAKVFSAATSGGGPVISIAGNNSIVNIKGRDDDGKNTLAVFGPTVVQSWASAASVYVDGGEYYRTKSDNLGHFQFQDLIDSRIENAIIYDPTATIFLVNGRYAATNGTASAKMVVDNCVIISGGNVVSHTYSTLDFTFTNCYISGDIAATQVYSGLTAGKITLGAGNRLNGKISGNVALADGLAYNTFSESVNVIRKNNVFKITADGVDPSTYVVTENEQKLDFNICTSKKGATAATVIWTAANGDILGFSTAMPGTMAKAPDDLSATVLVKDWLKIVPTEWENSLIVPENTDTYIITAKSGGKGEIIPAVDLQFGINLLTHFQYNLYIPLVAEGIEVTQVILRSDRTANYRSELSSTWEINGKLYNSTTAWPGLRASLDDAEISISFTYGGKTYTASATMNMVDYCAYVLDHSEYTEEQKDMAANVANYIYTGNVVIGNNSSENEEMYEIVANNTSRLLTPDESSLVIPNTYFISKYISGVNIVVADYGPKFRFTLTDAGKAASFVKLSTGHQDACDTKEEYSALGYIETRNTDIRRINSTTVRGRGRISYVHSGKLHRGAFRR